MRDDPGMITFVKQVEKHPCLWNYTLKEYNKKEATESAWRAIAAEISDSEHNCRDRWKNVRCCFVRSYGANKAKTRYYLADHLTFLIPYTKGKAGSNSRSVENDDTLDDERVADLFENTLDKTTEIKRENTSDGLYLSFEDAGYSLASSSSPRPVERERSLRERTFMTQTTDHKTDSELRPNNSNDDDVDVLFFRSIMPDVKKLPDKHKRVFKRKVMTLLEDLLDDMNGC